VDIENLYQDPDSDSGSSNSEIQIAYNLGYMNYYGKVCSKAMRNESIEMHISLFDINWKLLPYGKIRCNFFNFLPRDVMRIIVKFLYALEFWKNIKTFYPFVTIYDYLTKDLFPPIFYKAINAY
jgi:hypothetical protein